MNSEPYKVSSVCLRLFLFLYSTRPQYFVITYLTVAVYYLCAFQIVFGWNLFFRLEWSARGSAWCVRFSRKVLSMLAPDMGTPQSGGAREADPFAQKSGGNWGRSHHYIGRTCCGRHMHVHVCQDCPLETAGVLATTGEATGWKRTCGCNGSINFLQTRTFGPAKLPL